MMHIKTTIKQFVQKLMVNVGKAVIESEKNKRRNPPPAKNSGNLKPKVVI